MLASALGEHPDELRADFQSYYGLNLDRMGHDYTVAHAACLVSQLPEGARLWVAINPDAVWTADRTIMAAILNDLNVLLWSKTEDGRRKRNRPKPVGPFKSPGRHIATTGMSIEELEEALSRPRGGGNA